MTSLTACYYPRSCFSLLTSISFLNLRYYNFITPPPHTHTHPPPPTILSLTFLLNPSDVINIATMTSLIFPLCRHWPFFYDVIIFSSQFINSLLWRHSLPPPSTMMSLTPSPLYYDGTHSLPPLLWRHSLSPPSTMTALTPSPLYYDVTHSLPPLLWRHSLPPPSTMTSLFSSHRPSAR